MATALELQTQIDALRAARDRGVRRVRDTPSSGAVTEVEYRTDNEMAAAIADLERRLAVLTQPPIRTVRIITSKGI